MAVTLCGHLQSGGFDGDDDAAVAEILDADPFGTRTDVVDGAGNLDVERVAVRRHSGKWEF